jgi:hypothetical protein
MLKFENFLTPAERTQFAALVRQATEAGAQAVRFHSKASGVLVIGVCAGGELLTWFATPAHNAVEADVAHAVILSGITQAGATMAALQTGASDIAKTAIAKAAGMH